MDPTISVSKGCFVFKNGATRADKNARTINKRKRSVSSVLGKDIIEQPFYEAYKENWNAIEEHLERLQQDSYTKKLIELIEYIERQTSGQIEISDLEEILPAAALLTGINQPDHMEQFEVLKQRLQEEISSSICMLQSRDCSTLKAAVETMVYNFIEISHDDDEDRDHKRLRRNQCTLKQLKDWYKNNFSIKKSKKSRKNDDGVKNNSYDEQKQHALVIILPDFECFNTIVLQDLILILSSHCAELPFVLIMGIATAVSAIHNSLPYHVTSKMKLRVFQTQPAPLVLNEILENVILSPRYMFHLSGKTLKFLSHIFLYYDFSINGFIHGFKYCLMEHFFQGNAYALCTNYTKSLKRISALTHEDLESIRKLLSFRPYVESINDCKRIIAILTDDDYLKKKLPQLLRQCHIHFILLRIFLEFFTILVNDLPKYPLGRYRREIYINCLTKELNEQPEFKECWQILSFMSKDEFVAKISTAIKTTEVFINKEIKTLELATDCINIANIKLNAIKDLLTKVVMSGMEAKLPATKSQISPDKLKHLSSRHDLKEKLLQMSKQDKPITEFMKTVQETLEYIRKELVDCYLIPLERAPALHELFIFNDIGTIRCNIIGAPRAALHMALNNPSFYLQCKCCRLDENSQLLPSLPDLSVAYKLHLECGRMINLFDWLQAFRTVVDTTDVEQEQIDPQIQARFTRAVAELQFLGYIKMSKRKTDHATRLTW